MTVIIIQVHFDVDIEYIPLHVVYGNNEDEGGQCFNSYYVQYNNTS
jgi:hypothetical protein